MVNKFRKCLILTAILIVIVSTCLVFKIKSCKKVKQPHLTVIGLVCMADGIGRQAAELIDCLKDDITIGFKPTDKNIPKEGISESLYSILKNQKLPLGKVILYEDYLGLDGLDFKISLTGLKNRESIRIAYSMFESTRIPSEWVLALNHYFDAVAVPDKFLVDVYKNSGVTIPIFELPLGLNLDKFLNLPLKEKPNKPFVFANLSATYPRKNQLKLIQAFHVAFGNSPNVKLRINGRYSEPEYSQSIKNELYKLGATNIEFTEMRMQPDLYLKTFQEVDCYVSLSSGEGFSIQPREAMALGIPAIITNTTGQVTICKSNLGYAVPSLNPIPAFYPLFKNYYGNFYDCHVEDVVKALRDVYENYDHYLQQREAARLWVKQYTYDRLKPIYLGLINPKKIVLGEVNKITPDCLFTDSKELCEKFHRLLGTTSEISLNIYSKKDRDKDRADLSLNFVEQKH